MDYARDVSHGPWAGPEHACDPGTMKPNTPEWASGTWAPVGGMPIIASALGHLTTVFAGGLQKHVGSYVFPIQIQREMTRYPATTR